MDEHKRAIALGFFDGVHIGHAALMERTCQIAEKIDVLPSVLTFDTHPDTVVYGQEVPLLNDNAGRKEIISRLFGIEDIIFIHFNREIMHMPWKQFIDNIIEELNVAWIVVGHDFTFGDRGEGNAVRLQEYCDELGIGCDVIPAIMKDGRVVSSTYIRELIENGEMEKANEYLGHPHSLTDTVHTGFQLGTKMGTPTINMFFPRGVIIPQFGVYAAKVFLEDGSSHISVTNIGVRPTVSETHSVSVESYILDFDKNLYGKKVRVEFYKHLRNEQKFSSFEELSDQIRKDAEETRAFFKSK